MTSLEGNKASVKKRPRNGFYNVLLGDVVIEGAINTNQIHVCWYLFTPGDLQDAQSREVPLFVREGSPYLQEG